MIKKLVTASVLVSGFLSSTNLLALEWVQAYRNQCSTVCQQAGQSPVVGGQYYTGQPFYVCKGSTQGHADVRPGFNLPGFNPNSCEVSVGGSYQAANYWCLCD